jgi:hypothetical protein
MPSAPVCTEYQDKKPERESARVLYNTYAVPCHNEDTKETIYIFSLFTIFEREN